MQEINVQINTFPTECLHCKELVSEKDFKTYEGNFCCAGCKFVYSAISQAGLSDFYSYRDKLTNLKLEKGEVLVSHYAYLDDELLESKLLTKIEEDTFEATFRAQGMHCAACIWLLEKIPFILDGVLEARPSLLTKEVKVTLNKSRVKLSQIASLIKSYGYSPQAIEIGSQQKFSSHVLRGDIGRLAVATFCSMNAMMLAVSLYQGWWSGMEDQYRDYLNYISAGLSLPVVSYSALPFYKRAFNGLKNKSFHLDLPISIGVILGFILSFVSMFFGSGEVYFDSLSILVTLLLAARLIQDLGVLKFNQAICNQEEILTKEAKVVLDGEISPVYVERVAINDTIKITAGDIIPVDGVLTSGKVLVDSSIINGESEPVNLTKDDLVFAGTKVVEGECYFICTAPQSGSFFPRTLSQVKSRLEAGSEMGDLVDRRSRYFVVYILVAGIGAFIYHYFSSGLFRGLEVSMAVFVISCPCALGLSVPLSLSSAFFKASKIGILFSGASPIERLAKKATFFFDKTGTLTEHEMQVEDFISLSKDLKQEELNEIFDKISILEEGVFHPVAKALYNYIQNLRGESKSKFVIVDRQLLERGGISAQFQDGSRLKVGSLSLLSEEQKVRISESNLTSVVVKYEKSNSKEILVGQFLIKGKLRAFSSECISYLEGLGSSVFILSGDKREVVEALGGELGLSSSNCLYEKTALEKAEIVSSYKSDNKVMLGDGINDSNALSVSDVGISVSGGLSLLQKDGNVSITNFSLKKVVALIEGAKSTINTIRLNLSISLTYNIICTSLAVAGKISPLLAAVLMPLSSLSVITISMLGVKFKEKN